MSEIDKNKGSLIRFDWSKVKAIFAGARHINPENRSQYIREQSKGNKEIIQEVESLLSAYENTEFFLESPAIQVVADEIAETHSALDEGQFLKHYKIIRKIGTGGMSDVYLAQDNKLDRKVAIKILDKSLYKDQSNLKRFLREAKIASALNHPNVMTVHEVGETEGIHYIVCEFIEGEMLNTFVQKNALSLTEVIDLLIQVVSALVVAHKMGITHRDIKPENIMVRDDGFVKILDFGLAKLTRQGKAAISFVTQAKDSINTQKGFILGTVAYMSPEQARGKRIDTRSDLWSFGVILFQLITEKLPFSGETTSDILAAILKSNPSKLSEFVSGLPDELEDLIKKCLRKAPYKRYQKAEELLRDLKEIKQTLDTENTNLLPLGQVRRTHSQNIQTDQNITALTDGRENTISPFFLSPNSDNFFGSFCLCSLQAVRS